MLRSLLIIIFFIVFKSYSQNEPKFADSLSDKSFKELWNGFVSFKDNVNDTLKAEHFARAYIKKAKTQRDTLKIAEGFHMLISHFYDEKSYKYADSIIILTKDKPIKDYPLVAYILKGNIYYQQQNFKESLDHYLLARNYVGNNEYATYYINHQIGGIKSKLLLNKEALEIFRKSWGFVNRKGYKKTNKNEYIQALTDLSLQYVKNNMLDSATVLNKIGIQYALKWNNEFKYNLLVLNEGMNLYNQDKKQQAKDSIVKAMKYYLKGDDYNSLAYCYYYLANIYREEKNYEEALLYNKKIDTLFDKAGNLHPQLRGSYESLINYYKEIGNKDSVLLYVEKLLKVDSVLSNNFKYLSPKIIKEYETPKLLREKELIIEASKNKNNRILKITVFFISLFLILSLLLIYNLKRQKLLKIRFKNLLEQLEDESAVSSKRNKIVLEDNPHTTFGISDLIVTEILGKLEDFEKGKGYLQNGLTLNEMAKTMQTNSRYLSMVINKFKNQNFVNYINKLRIDYSIRRLKKDATFRKYTIKAIAHEVGFNSAESFSTAFYKETHLKPSYFLKNIENE